MTDRKPADLSWTSWIEQQIGEAAERGAFDNLPGSGKPLPRRREDAAQAWLREYALREGVAAQEMLPEPLRLRKQSEQLAAAAPALRTEQEVREAVAELNERITKWRRLPLGPPIFVALVDEDAMLARWREAHPPEPADTTARGGGPGDQAAARPRRRRGWRLTRRRGDR